MIASGPTITDPEILRELALPDYESAVEFAQDLLQAQPELLDLDGLAAYVEAHHTHDLFRLETLNAYAVESDGDDYFRYIRGEDHPNADAKRQWLDRLRTDTDAGRCWRRVHAVTLPLSDYLCYEAEWCYTFNVAAGEDVRIVDSSPSLLAVGDFFVFDGQHVVRSIYDNDGTFIGAEVLNDTAAKAPYIAISDLSWRMAEPFTSWWLRNPQFHRAA